MPVIRKTPLLILICPGDRIPLPSLPAESYTPQLGSSDEPVKSSRATRLVQPYRPAAVPSERPDGARALDCLGEGDRLGDLVGLGEVDGLGASVVPERVGVSHCGSR